MTQGRGTFTMELATYRKTPMSVQEEVIAEKKRQLAASR
jgi:translation elongation factor EF-G